MKKENVFTNLSLILLLGVFLSSCDYYNHLEKKAKNINRYEKVSYQLARENRELEVEISRLNYEIQELKHKNNFLTIQMEEKKSKGRGIASVKKVHPKNDLVKFDVYKWSPSQILAVANTEFNRKNYEKAAQFFRTFIENFPGHKLLNDQVLFKAGIASFETGKHHDWTKDNFKRLMKKYPTSKFYRGAKLWTALTNLKLGDKKEFFNTVEEFRKKYRNTSEWKILSAHYENLLQRYKN